MRQAALRGPRLSSTLFAAAAALICCAPPVLATGNPPQVIDHKTEHTFRVGQVIKLSCPVIGDSGIMLYSWKKSKTDLRMLSDRFKLLRDDRVVKSKAGAGVEDRGSYKCTGVNGFGRKEVTFVVHVIDPNAPLSPSQCARNDQGKHVKGAPCFIDMTQMKPQRIEREVGQEVQFSCSATGKDSLRYDWFKDSSKANWITTAEGFRSSILTIRHLQQTHTGRYTCRVTNDFGELKYEYTLVVKPSIKSQPQIVGLERQNITVDFGEQAQLICRVRSVTAPHIRWMKQIDPRAKWTGNTLYGDLKKGFEVSALKKQLFVVLKGSTMFKDSSGDFVSKRVIQKVERKHLGKYLCVVFGRPHGKLVYQESFLKLRRQRRTGSGWSSSDGGSSQRGTNPLHLIFYIGVPLIVFVICMGVIIFCFVSRRLYRNNGRHLGGSLSGRSAASGGGSGGSGGYILKSSGGQGPPYGGQTKYQPHPVPQYEPYPLPAQPGPNPPVYFQGAGASGFHSSSSNGYSGTSGGGGSGGGAGGGGVRAYNT